DDRARRIDRDDVLQPAAGAVSLSHPSAAPHRARRPRSRGPEASSWPVDPMRKILILGVNGFIGHHLSQRIIASTDWEIYGMDMQTDRIADLMSEKRFHFFEGDITINKEGIEYHIKKCDTVLPLVAIAAPGTDVR